MRKKLDTRFPAARIKKIMQADEDVGKIAMAVPLLVSKALELFLQDLCNRTYDITLRRGAKTMTALHLKHCVQTFNVFDFLKDILNKVPDLGGSGATGDDRSIPKRRKVAEGDDNDSDEEQKRNKMLEARNTSGRGRGKGRGRGRGRGHRTADHDHEMISHVKFEDESDVLKQNGKHTHSSESPENVLEHEEVKPGLSVSRPAEVCVRNIDLNMAPVDEDMDSFDTQAPVPVMDSSDTQAPVPVMDSSDAPTPVPVKQTVEEKHEEYPGWSFSDMEKMSIDTIQLANINGRIDEDDEDYDEET